MHFYEHVPNPSREATTKWWATPPTRRVVSIVITLAAAITAARDLGDAMFQAWSWIDGLHILW
jgi:hypothetical protein